MRHWMSSRAPRRQESTLFYALIKEEKYLWVTRVSEALPERRVIQKPWLQTLVAHLLQQPLLHFFLTGDTMLCPRHGLQPLLLELFLAIRAYAVLVALNALQRCVNHVQDCAVRVGHPKQKFLRIGVRRLVRQVN